MILRILCLLCLIMLGAEANELRFYLAPIIEMEGSSFSLEYQVKKHLKDKKAQVLSDAELTKELRSKTEMMTELKIKLIQDTIKADYFIFVKNSEVNKRKMLELEVYDQQRKKIYSKQKMMSSAKALEPQDITFWIDDFLVSMPTSGEIVSRKGKNIEIKFNKFLAVKDGENARFEILDEDKIVGAGSLKGNKGDIFLGEIQEENETLIKIGLKVNLIENKQEKERVTESLTETNRSLIYNNPFKFSMRACTLLPLIGGLPKQDLDKDYKATVKMIESAAICAYRSSDKMLSIMESYGEGEQHLYNKEVLKIFAEKLGAGSLIRIKLAKGTDGHSLIFDILAENGENIYFSRSKFFKDYNSQDIISQVKEWLIDYDKEIPYQGRVVEVLGDKVMIDFDRDSKYQDSQHFMVFRPSNLKIRSKVGVTYIEWDKYELAQGTFTEVTEDYSVGVIRKFSSNQKKLQAGDWIITDDQLFLDGQTDYLYTKHNVKNKNRKIGRIKVGLDYSMVEVSRDQNEKSFVGGRLDFDYYLPYGFLFALGAKRNFTGDDNFSASGSNLDVALGFSFTPKKKWFLSALDFYVGYKMSDYNFDAKPSSVFDQLNFKAPYGALAFELPLSKRFLLTNNLKVMPKVSTKNTRKKIEVYQSVKGVSNNTHLIYQLKNQNGLYLGINYSQYSGVTNSAVDFKLTDISPQFGYMVNF